MVADKTRKKGLSAAARSLALSAAVFAAQGAIADASLAVDASRAVTGAEETYSYAFIGSDGAWGNAANWTPGTPDQAWPNAPGSNCWDPLLFDAANLPEGATTDIAMETVEGWNLRIGLYGGVNVTIGTLNYWAGGVGNYVRVDKDSKLVVNGLGAKNFVGSVVYHVAAEDGISYPNGFDPAGWTAALNIKYCLHGEGSVSYGAAVANKGTHTIMFAEADMTHPAAKELKSKKLVSFASSAAAFRASSDTYVQVDSFQVHFADGALPTSATLSAADKVGACQLVQASDGVYLYWVDGPYDTTAINLNFTYHAEDGDDIPETSDTYGAAPWCAAPGSAWNNIHPTATEGAFPSAAYTGIAQYDNATGEETILDDVTVAISGSRGSYRCENLAPAAQLQYGYIDDQDADGMRTPTVTISNIPYEHYRVVVIMATDTASAKFGVVNINGKDYKGENGATVLAADNADVWGDAGPSNGALPLREGVNYLVSPITSGATATIVGKRADSNKRGTIAAVQIVKQELPSFEADGGTKTLDAAGEGEDIVINVTEDTVIDLESDKGFGSVSIMGVSGKTLTFTGAAFSAAQLTLSCEGSGTIVTADGGAFSAAATTILEQLTVGADVELGEVALGGAASLAVDATAGLPTPSASLKALLQNGIDDKEVIVKGEGENGITLDYSNNGTTKWTAHTVFDGGVHNLTATSGGQNWIVCDNSSNSDPLWTVNDGTILNLTAKDLGGWQGDKKANSCVIAVRDGGTLIAKNSGTDTFYYQGRFCLEPGATMKVRLNEEKKFRINGGIYTDENGAKYAQFFVPDQTAASEKTARIVEDDGASYADIATAEDSTPGFGIYVGANATLDWGVPLRNGNGASNVAKFGSGTWNMMSTGLAEGDDWTGALQLYAGAIRVNRYGIGRTLQVKGDATLEAAADSMWITGLSAIDAGKTLTIACGQLSLGELRPEGAIAFSGSGNKLYVTLAEGETSVTLNVSGDISADDVIIYESGESDPTEEYIASIANGVLTIAPPSAWVMDASDDNATPYATLQDAVDAVPDGWKIYVTGDCGDAAVSAAKSFTIEIDDGTIGEVTAAEGYTLEIDGNTYTATIKQTVFTWAATTEGNWNDVANWTIDGGQSATRIPSMQYADSVILGDGAIVVVPEGAACPGFAVNGDVTIKGSQDFQLYGDITGEGTLTLRGAGLKNFASQAVTVQPDVVFAMDGDTAPWLAANGSCPGITIEGDVTISGTYKNWDIAHTFAGATTFSGACTVDGNAKLVMSGTATLDASASLAVSGFGNFGMEFGDVVTVGAGVTLTLPEDKATAGEGASFVLAAADAAIIDNAGIAVGKVSTTVAGASVAYDSDTNTYSVSGQSGEGTTIDINGCKFTVGAELAADIASATGAEPGSDAFAKAAIACVVGGEIVGDEIVIPTPTISVNATSVTVTFTSEDAMDAEYDITCTLQCATAITSPMAWSDVEGATDILDNKSAFLEDSAASGPGKFYRVVVTVGDKE